MKMFFAGSDNLQRFNDVLLKAGVKNRLESYFTLGGKPGSTGFETYLLDSGGFAARTRNVVISVQEYAAYINRHNVKYAFNLDTNDTPETLRNQEYLEKNTSAYIIPIYHASDWIKGDNLLDKFIADGYTFIALGGMAGAGNSRLVEHQFLSHCFRRTRDKVKVHGLGKTAIGTIQKFPFYSVDSSSWLVAGRYGGSTYKAENIAKFHAKTRHYLQNTKDEVERWLEIEKEVNQLWRLRGIEWDNDPIVRPARSQ